MQLPRRKKLATQPVDPAKFVDALDKISKFLKETTGQSAEITGDTRVIVPLALLLSPTCSQGEIVSILLRIRAYQLLFKEGVLDDWVRPNPSGSSMPYLHIAVAEAAAIAPITEKDDRFAVNLFLDQVEEIASTKYADEADQTLEMPAL